MRNTALWLGLFVAATFAQSLDTKNFGINSFGGDFGTGSISAPPVQSAPDNPVFYDHPLIAKQYGAGVVGSVVAGALFYYLGNAFESGILSTGQEGYLSFTGINYHNNRGPFWGGASGVLLGSTLAVFFIGETDEEQGSIFWTVFGGLATTAAAFELASLSGVNHEGHHLLPFVPLVFLPTTGAVAGYDISRWFNDKKRKRITDSESAMNLQRNDVMLLPPKLALAPDHDGMAFRLDALNLSF